MLLNNPQKKIRRRKRNLRKKAILKKKRNLKNRNLRQNRMNHPLRNQLLNLNLPSPRRPFGPTQALNLSLIA